MTIELNHTIAPARDKERSARFFADISGLSMEVHLDAQRHSPTYVRPRNGDWNAPKK